MITPGYAYMAAISEGQEAERSRLAGELHDTTIQSLIAVAQRLERAGRLIETDPDRARTVVAEAREETLAAVTNLRELIAGLRPPALEELGLVPALELMIARATPPPVVQLHVEGPVRRLTPELELAVFRMVQEALSNVRRHGDAATTVVILRYETDGIMIVVEDDGIGIGEIPSVYDLVGSGRWGLIGLHERAAYFNGTVELGSAPDGGTRLTIHLPDRGTPQPRETVVDPVCKATIQPETAYGAVEHAGTIYFLCCPVCHAAFKRDPAKYATG